MSVLGQRAPVGRALRVGAMLFLVSALAVAATLVVGGAMSARAAFAATGNIVVPDEVQRGGLRIRKLVPLDSRTDMSQSDRDRYAGMQGDTSVIGTEFTIYLAKGNPVYVGGRAFGVGEAIMTICVDSASGVAETPNNHLPYGTYIVRETKVMPGQYPAKNADGSAWQREVVIHSDMTVVDAGTVENPTWKGSLSVTKRDSELGTAQGEGTLAGTRFSVWNRSEAPVIYQGNVVLPDNKVADLVTDANGYAELPASSLDYGTYEVIEDAPPTGYLPVDGGNWSSGEIIIRRENFTGRVEAPVCANPVIRGGLRLYKYDIERLSSGEDTHVAQGDGDLDAEYTVYSLNDQHVKVGGSVYLKDEAVVTLKANDYDGSWSVPGNMLPYGTYVVRETKAPRGYHIDSDWSYQFSVRDNGRVYGPTAEQSNQNQVVRGGIRVIKIDKDSESVVPQGDASFNGIEIQVFNVSDHAVYYNGRWFQPNSAEPLTTMTMTSGVAQTGQADLSFGRYRLRESKVPAGGGYRLNPGWQPVVEVRNEGEWAIDTSM